MEATQSLTYYSPSAKGFFLQVVHGENIPTDSIIITDKLYRSLLIGQEEGKVIMPPTGTIKLPYLADPLPPTVEESAELARSRRDRLLAASDVYMLSDYPLTSTMKTAWKTYRQTLRDIPTQPGFPQNIIWPAKPE